MGACCERIEVNEKEKRDDLLSNRKNSILFERIVVKCIWDAKI